MGGLLSNPSNSWGPQNSEQLVDLPHTEKLLGKLCGSKTRTVCNTNTDKIQNILMLAHTAWSEMEQETLDDLIANGCANATHDVCFPHNPAGANGKTNKECIHCKKAHITIVSILVGSKCDSWIKKMALCTWINKFLPKHKWDIFPKEQLQKLHNLVC